MVWHAPPVVYRINADDVIEDVNDAWVQFAEENGAPSLAHDVVGKSLWDYIAGDGVRQLYAAIMECARTHQRRMSFPFRCDSPVLYRAMRLHVAPLGGGRLEFCALLETIRLHPQKLVILEHSRTSRPVRTLPMCSWCKAILLGSRWVPIEQAMNDAELFTVADMPGIDQTLCVACQEEFERDYAADDPTLTAEINSLLPFVRRWFNY